MMTGNGKGPGAELLQALNDDNVDEVTKLIESKGTHNMGLGNLTLDSEKKQCYDHALARVRFEPGKKPALDEPTLQRVLNACRKTGPYQMRDQLIFINYKYPILETDNETVIKDIKKLCIAIAYEYDFFLALKSLTEEMIGDKLNAQTREELYDQVTERFNLLQEKLRLSGGTPPSFVAGSAQGAISFMAMKIKEMSVLIEHKKARWAKVEDTSLKDRIITAPDEMWELVLSKYKQPLESYQVILSKQTKGPYTIIQDILAALNALATGVQFQSKTFGRSLSPSYFLSTLFNDKVSLRRIVDYSYEKKHIDEKHYNDLQMFILELADNLYGTLHFLKEKDKWVIKFPNQIARDLFAKCMDVPDNHFDGMFYLHLDDLNLAIANNDVDEVTKLLEKYRFKNLTFRKDPNSPSAVVDHALARVGVSAAVYESSIFDQVLAGSKKEGPYQKKDTAIIHHNLIKRNYCAAEGPVKVGNVRLRTEKELSTELNDRTQSLVRLYAYETKAEAKAVAKAIAQKEAAELAKARKRQISIAYKVMLGFVVFASFSVATVWVGTWVGGFSLITNLVSGLAAACLVVGGKILQESLVRPEKPSEYYENSLKELTVEIDDLKRKFTTESGKNYVNDLETLKMQTPCKKFNEKGDALPTQPEHDRVEFMLFEIHSLKEVSDLSGDAQQKKMNATIEEAKTLLRTMRKV